MRETKQRKIILETLRASKDHPSADQVYDRVRQVIPKISLGTVYRNLEILSARGEILKLDNGGGQKRFDANISEHIHFRCVLCGAVEDTPFIPEKIREDDSWAGGRSIQGRNIEYYGLCENCAAMNRSDGNN